MLLFFFTLKIFALNQAAAQKGTAFRSIADSVLNYFIAGRPHRMNRPHMRGSTPTDRFLSILQHLELELKTKLLRAVVT